MPGTFPVIPLTAFDYNYTTVNDNRTSQYLKDNVVELTAGKMLGGSSALDHMIYVQGDPHDYDNWAEILGDSSWNYTNIIKYMKMQENLTDPGLLTTSYASLHGTSGPIKLRRQTSTENDGILAAAVELGYDYVEDTSSATSTLGITEPLFSIDDQIRQSNADTYFTKTINRTNLCLTLYTTATRILFSNTTAIGVEVVDSSGDVYVLYTNKEVIVSAGALNSPKLLMLSGVGPAAHLESLDISVVANLTVGENLLDHPSASLLYQMEADTSTIPPTNPLEFPVPTTCLYGALTSSQTYPDYQAIILRFPHDSTALVQLCTNSFKFKNSICDAAYAGSAGRRILYIVLNLMIPVSRGKLLLSSSDYTDDPIVYHGIYSDSEGYDLANMTQALAAINNFTTTSYFQSVNATLLDPGMCSDYTGSEYWECYALGMSATMWHYGGTCSMGTVVDTELLVKGLTNLRVVDASVMPTMVSGNIKAAINMIAERAAAMVYDTWNITTSS